MNNVIMKTNDEVIEAFFKGELAHSTTLTTDGSRLFSYNTCIAQFDSVQETLYVNTTKYSSTTSRHQNKVLKEIDKNKYFCIFLQDVPRDANNLHIYLNDYEAH